MERKIYQELINWKNTNMKKPLMVIGARQIGKTYIINEFCKKEFKKYIYINLLEHLEIVEIFKQKINTEEKYKRMKVYLGTDIDIENTIIFFDEIQESEELISALKFFNEREENFKIICAGSLLGVKLKRMHSSFPVGKVKMLTLYPLDFEEFLWALDKKDLANMIRQAFSEDKEFSLHILANEYYRLYLAIGGMPRAILEYKLSEKYE